MAESLIEIHPMQKNISVYLISNNIIPASKDSNHSFNRDAMFTIIEQIKTLKKPNKKRSFYCLKERNFGSTNYKL